MDNTSKKSDAPGIKQTCIWEWSLISSGDLESLAYFINYQYCQVYSDQKGSTCLGTTYGGIGPIWYNNISKKN